MKTFIRALLVALSFALTSSLASAAADVEISAAGSKKESQTTDENRAQYTHLGLVLSMPFGIDLADGKITGYAAKLKVAQTTLDPIPQIDRKVSITESTLGASYFSITGDKSLFAATLAAHVTSDGKANSDILPVGAVLGSSLLSENFLALYGAAFTYVYGDGLLLPILGFSWKTSESSRLVFILPLSIKYVMNLAEKSQLEIFLKPQGLRSVIANKGDFSTSQDDLQFRLREVTLGARYRYHIEKDMAFFVEAGVRGHRELSVLDGSNKVYDKDLTSTGYAGVGFKIGFGDHEKARAENDVTNEF